VGTALVILLAVLAFCVLVVGAVTWAIFAFVRHLWREVRRTPTFGQVSRGVSMARPVIAYREALRRAPSEATELVVRIQRKAMALDAVKEHLGPEPRFRVGETTARYLPDTMQAYRVASVGQGRQQRLEASRLLLQQLAQMDRNLDRIASGAGETGIQALRANGAFLGEIGPASSVPATPSIGESEGEDERHDAGPGTSQRPA
jgi:hypothetical protein